MNGSAESVGLDICPSMSLDNALYSNAQKQRWVMFKAVLETCPHEYLKKKNISAA